MEVGGDELDLFQALEIRELGFAKDECPKGMSPVEMYEQVLSRTSSLISSAWKRHSQTLY